MILQWILAFLFYSRRDARKIFKHLSFLSFMKVEEALTLFMKKLQETPDFDRVKFAFLFGSHAEGKANKFSDFDFAVYYDGSSKERFKFRIHFGGQLPEKFDLQVFQDLPLYVQKEVLKGKLIYCTDLQFAYDCAYETLRRFEDFKRGYYDYIRHARIQ